MAGNPLLAILVLLVVAVALVPVFKWLGLGTVLGYLAAGVIVGPYGLRLISDTETIRSVSEFGVVIMLFLIGLEVHPLELWRMRHKVLGLGVTQMLATSAILAAAALAMGVAWQAAVVIGLGLAMSSTAIAMQSAEQRSVATTETGRAALVTLLVQDMAVIPVLALIPVLAATRRAVPELGQKAIDNAADAVSNPYGWWIALVIIGGFIAVTLASRYLINPLMRFMAMAKVPESFTALGLLLVIGAAFATESLGLSPALGAFLGGVLLADSEYRHELEGNLEPFKGLLLGLFFISVGMGIAFGVLAAQPIKVLSLVAMLMGIKIGVLYLLGTVSRMHVADRLLFAILLSQAGEFAFVLLQFAQSATLISDADHQLWAGVVALSMALTPFLLLIFDKVWVPRLNAAAAPPLPDDLPKGRSVIVLGYGRFGQIVTRLLRAQGYSMTLIDDDPVQIELVKRFGVKVFYGDGGRLDLLRAAGAGEADLIVIAVAGGDRILAIAELIRRHFPKVKIAARAIDRGHAHQLMALGVEELERETFRGALALGQKALVALGHSPQEATRIADAFDAHDQKLLSDSFALREDREAYIGFVRKSTEMLDEAMKSDREAPESIRARSKTGE
ncbi:MAG TPA: monovalent cation:proton antiporter-2 (CPA2) family protein [Devosia sp.]|nr:monovalent cation:proton antiporter-2 (CPA2) family protein [Devosia sp.]